VAEGQLTLAGRKFLQAAEGIDQRRIIECAARFLCAKIPNATMDDAIAAVWGDASRLFGWMGDVADLETGGSA
jgi:hypothetical protein